MHLVRPAAAAVGGFSATRGAAAGAAAGTAAREHILQPCAQRGLVDVHVHEHQAVLLDR